MRINSTDEKGGGRRIGPGTTIQGRTYVILVTRLNGPVFALNPDLIERADATPDTVITMVDGSKYVVSEPVVEVIARIRDYRASVIATAHAIETHAYAAATQERARPVSVVRAGDQSDEGNGTVVPLQRREG